MDLTLGGVSEKSQNPEDWAPIVERVTFQVFYRSLGMVALPAGIDIVSKAIDILSSKGMGTWKWLITDRVLVWQGIPVDSALKVHCYVFGSKYRPKNTVLVRQGFWRMYFFELGLKTLDVFRPLKL